jgi:hypothetical protein
VTDTTQQYKKNYQLNNKIRKREMKRKAIARRASAETCNKGRKWIKIVALASAARTDKGFGKPAPLLTTECKSTV